MTRVAVALAAAALAGCGPAPAGPAATPALLVEREAVLMGTRVRIAAYAGTREHAQASTERALASLEQTEAELTTWRDDSVVSRLNRQPVDLPFALPAPACRLFSALERATLETSSAFDPAIGALARAWDIHGRGSLPNEAALESARARSGWRWLAFDPASCRITRRGEVTVDVGAFGKGEALDRAREHLSGAWLIDLGGQVAVGGTPPGERGWRVGIAHPGLRDRPLFDVVLAGGSLATSGGSERDIEVAGVRVGHVLDPRTGRPAPFEGSVVVWHADGLQADMLSTALYVMGPRAGGDWARARGLAAAFLVPRSDDVELVETPAFARLRTQPPPAAGQSSKN